MKTELSKIAQDLEQGNITENEAQTLLLGLLGVSKHLPTSFIFKYAHYLILSFFLNIVKSVLVF